MRQLQRAIQYGCQPAESNALLQLYVLPVLPRDARDESHGVLAVLLMWQAAPFQESSRS